MICSAPGWGGRPSPTRTPKPPAFKYCSRMAEIPLSMAATPMVAPAVIAGDQRSTGLTEQRIALLDLADDLELAQARFEVNAVGNVREAKYHDAHHQRTT